jgi:hypothetical protein
VARRSSSDPKLSTLNKIPNGSKHKLSEEFIAALCEDFERHGIAAIEKVRVDKPADYLRVIASVIPKEITVNPNPLEDMTDEELREALAVVNALIAQQLGFELPKPRNEVDPPRSTDRRESERDQGQA